MYGQDLLGGPAPVQQNNWGFQNSWGVGNPMMSGEVLSPMAPTSGDFSLNNAPQNVAIGGNFLKNSGLGMNIGTANLALSGLNTIGNLWAAFEARKLAKEQFNFTKSVTNTNLANSISAYNTALSDRSRARGFTEGQTQEQIDKYIADNRAVNTAKRGG